ncbi:hypothetical protein MPTA5024_24715 [Microbispora sp. ATCC PTA-5024]|nr:hypothetical protein MPTA5024_24715 [Microbispora sp. ATCC PTA-5024]
MVTSLKVTDVSPAAREERTSPAALLLHSTPVVPPVFWRRAYHRAGPRMEATRQAMEHPL